MDGVFYYDLVRGGHLHDVHAFAVNYYLQYPALTVLFYPPLFPVVEALFYAIFGVSHATAQLTVAFFYLLAMTGAYYLSRRLMTAPQAFAVALLFAGFPEIAFWGRQVMLEIPAIACVLWGAHVLFRYVETERPRFLYLFTALILAAIYTKQTAAWFVVPCVVLLARSRGVAFLRDRHFRRSAVFFFVGLAPLGIVTLKFGAFNMNTFVLGDERMIPVASLKGVSYYLRQLPDQVGWIPLILAAAYTVHLLLVRGLLREKRNLFMALWFLTGYVFFSLVALKESRHTTVILFPIALFSVLVLPLLFSRRVADLAAILLAALVFARAQYTRPAPFINGYQQAVDYVVKRAPTNSAILFSGLRDGNVVFNLRAGGLRPDIAVLRSDKLLLRVGSGRKEQAKELDVDPHRIGDLLTGYRISYVINQPNFWDDIGAMRRLQDVLHTDQFRRVAVVPVTANVEHLDTELEIYENVAPLPEGNGHIRMELPIVGVTLDGAFGSKLPKATRPGE